ncbi:MAG: TauD/TfdA family dioxygenase [Methylococcaceae bacterium]|nr:TauD/TfdA family dioxygenase [Methylococcaceae bacterium]
MSVAAASELIRQSIPTGFSISSKPVSPDAVHIAPTGGALGAVVTGLDAGRPLSSSTVLQLKQAWEEHLILIFKDQTLTDRQYLDFATYFGNVFQPPQDVPVLASHPDGTVPEIVLVANIEGGHTGTGELSPHSDHHWTPYPSKASLLYALEVPEEGGDTYWSNLYQVYEDLDGETQRRIEDLQLITYNPFKRKPSEPRPKYRDPGQPPLSEAYPHPLVATHPQTGRKLLYLDYSTEVEVVGLPPSEGEELIERLREHLNQPKYYYHHRWQVGDVVLWDNLATLHYRPAFDPNSRRVLKRISLAGGRPF